MAAHAAQRRADIEQLRQAVSVRARVRASTCKMRQAVSVKVMVLVKEMTVKVVQILVQNMTLQVM